MEQKLIFGQIPPQEIEARQHTKTGRIRREEVGQLAQQKELGVVQPRFDLPTDEVLQEVSSEQLKPEPVPQDLAHSPLAEAVRKQVDREPHVVYCGDHQLPMTWNGKKVGKGGRYVCPHCSY